MAVLNVFVSRAVWSSNHGPGKA